MPERVGGEVADRLSLPDQQREVVGEHVGEGDRHERVREGARRAEWRRTGSRPNACRECRPCRSPDDGDRQQHAEAVGELVRRCVAEAQAGEHALHVGLEVVPDDAVGCAVERGDADDVSTSATVPRSMRRRGTPVSGRRSHSARSRTSKQAQAREQAEVAAEGVAALAPLLDPEQRHAERASARSRRATARRARRVVVVVVDKLQPAEREQSDHDGPAAEPIGIGERRGRFHRAAVRSSAPRARTRARG